MQIPHSSPPLPSPLPILANKNELRAQVYPVLDGYITSISKQKKTQLIPATCVKQTTCLKAPTACVRDPPDDETPLLTDRPPQSPHLPPLNGKS